MDEDTQVQRERERLSQLSMVTQGVRGGTKIQTQAVPLCSYPLEVLVTQDISRLGHLSGSHSPTVLQESSCSNESSDSHIKLEDNANGPCLCHYTQIKSIETSWKI